MGNAVTTRLRNSTGDEPDFARILLRGVQALSSVGFLLTSDTARRASTSLTLRAILRYQRITDRRISVFTAVASRPCDRVASRPSVACCPIFHLVPVRHVRSPP